MIAIVKKLQDHFGVPISEGTYFGRLGVKVAGRATLDVDFSLIRELFMRRTAAEALRGNGFDLDWAPLEVHRNNSNFDFVQILSPVVAFGVQSSDDAFCSVCYRMRWGKGPSKAQLYDSPSIYEYPVFKTVNIGNLVISQPFIVAAKQLGIRGFVEGKTIVELQVVADPEPNRKPLLSPRQISGVKVSVTKSAEPQLTVLSELEWLDHLADFVKFVKERGGEGEVLIGQKSKDRYRDLPRSLQKLLEACGGRLEFSYGLKLSAVSLSGGFFLRKETMGELKEECRLWAEESWVSEDPEQQIIWRGTLPFTRLKNGDYLGLDMRNHSDDPPVVYLNHEEGSEIIAPSLGAFLAAWERILYQGPEIWVIAPFQEAKTGFFSPTEADSVKIRTAIGFADHKSNS